MPGIGSLRQSQFRFRKDDGTETTASWEAAVDTNISKAKNRGGRLRIESKSEGGSNNLIPQWQYSHRSADDAIITPFTNITTTSLYIQAVAGSVADGTATTEQLAGSGTFFPGEISTDGLSPAVGLTGGNDTEHELVYRLVAGDLQVGEKIDIRLSNAGVAYSTYTVTPRITVTDPVDDGGLLLTQVGS